MSLEKSENCNRGIIEHLWPIVFICKKIVNQCNLARLYSYTVLLISHWQYVITLETT